MAGLTADGKVFWYEAFFVVAESYHGFSWGGRSKLYSTFETSTVSIVVSKKWEMLAYSPPMSLRLDKERRSLSES